MEDEEFEILFWKVMNNKFIFNKIFHLIETVDWVEYTHINQIHINNRVKFKNIHSLEWMIVNKLYELLKCKLKYNSKLSKLTLTTGSDNFIEITESGMNRLLGLGNIEKKDQTFQQYEIDKLILSELLPLILDTKKLEIANINLPLLSLKNNNLTALKILLNEPYSYQIFPSDLEWSIKNSSTLIVNELIELSLTNDNIIISSEQIRNKSIVWAFENIFHRDEMLKLIFNNPKLYNSPTINSPIDNYEKLNIRSLFVIKSLEIQNKLLDLNYIKEIESTILPKSNDSNVVLERLSKSISKIIEIKNEQFDRPKELYKLFAIEFYSWCKGYLLKYDEPVKGLDLISLISHCLSTFSVKTLLYLIENEYNNIKQHYLIISKIKDNSKIQLIPTPKFIKLYFNNEIFNNLQCNERIDNYILGIGSSNQYELIINEISNCNKYPLKWNSILSFYNKIENINISDKETIDYLVKFNSNTFIQNIIGQLKSDNFKSCELIEYAIHSFNEHLITISKLNYLDTFHCALDNCDTDSLIRCSSNNQINVIKNENTFKMIGKQPIENLNKLFNHINSINYINLMEPIFIPLITSLSICTDKSLDEIEQISIHSSLFIQYQDKSITELVLAISQYQPKKIQLILNNFNPISILSNQFKEFWDINVTFNHHLYNNERNITFLPNELKETVIQSIEIILEHYVGEITDTQAPLPINIEMYSIIINYLYKCLVSIENVGVSSIFKVLNLVNSINMGRNQQIIIEHSLFHSFFYICIKSIKFQKFLMELPFIIGILDFGDELQYNNETLNLEYGGYNIKNYLDPSIFTFDYIFGGTSFDDILYKIIIHSSILPGINDKEMVNYELIEGENYYYSDSIDSILLFCLEIKNSYLIFKILDQIQIHLNDKTIDIGNGVSSKITTKIKSFDNYNNNGKFELYQQTITNGRVIQFSQEVFNLACPVFENSESDFQKFISFCNYYSILDFLSNVDQSFINEHYLNHFDQYKSIFNNYYPNIQFFKVDNLHDPNESDLMEIGSSLGHGISFDHDGLAINHLIKYQNYFINNSNIVDNLIIDYDKLLILLKRNNNLVKFNLILRELFSNCLNQGIIDYFKITKSTIDNAINNGKIGYLKYYFEIGIINNDNYNNDNQNQLLQYLKQQLSLHTDYKYVNWLN